MTPLTPQMWLSPESFAMLSIVMHLCSLSYKTRHRERLHKSLSLFSVLKLQCKLGGNASRTLGLSAIIMTAL